MCMAHKGTTTFDPARPLAAGIPTVAVFSEADRGAQHVARAGEAFCIGPPAARDSYLCQDRILEARPSLQQPYTLMKT